MSEFLIFVPYLVGLVDNITSTLSISLFTLFSVLLVYSIDSVVESRPNKMFEFLRNSDWTKRILLIAILFLVFLPSKTTVYQMLGFWGGIEIVQSDSVQRIAPKTLKVLENMMDEYLVDTNKTREVKE